jgi:hypothetical protein
MDRDGQPVIPVVSYDDRYRRATYISPLRVLDLVIRLRRENWKLKAQRLHILQARESSVSLFRIFLRPGARA